MATIADKFRKIRIAPTVQIGQRQNWIDYVQANGWVWSDERNDWSITVSSGTFWGQELSRGRWRELIDQYISENAATYSNVSKTGTYQLLYDSAANAYYYIDTLGKKIYDYSAGQNPQTDIFIGKNILETPNYDFSESIKDILGNQIYPKTPEVGLYDTKDYFDLLTKTRKQYAAFWASQTDTERIAALEQRATDIVAEEGRIINLLSIAQKAKTTDNVIINTVSLVASIFGGGGGKASGVAVQTAIRFAQSQTTDRRINLLGEDLKYIDAEYAAIKAYFDERNASLANVTASSQIGKWLVQNWGWIVAASVSLATFIYIYRKRTKTNEK
jgi:hypothetical protein